MMDYQRLGMVADRLEKLSRCCRAACNGDTHAIDIVLESIDYEIDAIVVGCGGIVDLLAGLDPRQRPPDDYDGM